MTRGLLATTVVHGSIGRTKKRNFPDVQLQDAAVLHCVMWLKTMAKTLSLSTINRRLAWLRKHSGVRALHDPTLAPELDKTYKDLIQDLKRGKHQERVRGKKPLLLPMLKQIWNSMKGETLSEQQGRLWLTLTWFTAMRRSETRASKWKDIEFRDRGVAVRIWVSKTGIDQAVAVNVKPEEDMCVVKALKAWKETTQGETTDYLFRTIKTAGDTENLHQSQLPSRQWVSYVKSGVLACGKESAASWSCHSIRAGFVTENAHRDMAVVMKQTRHKTLAAASVYMRSAEMFDAGF